MNQCAQSIYEVYEHQKADLLIHLLSLDGDWDKTVIFVRNREALHALNTEISHQGISTEAITGNKKPEARERALADLKNGVTQVLLATETVLRETNLSGIHRVIQFDFPELDQDYLKRIASTAEEVTTFVTQADHNQLKKLEELAGMEMERKTAEGFVYDDQPKKIRIQPKKGQSNRSNSKPLQNKKPKLKNKGPRRKTGRTRKR